MTNGIHFRMVVKCTCFSQTCIITAIRREPLTPWMSIPRFQHFSYHPAPAELLSLHPQLAVLPQQFLSPRNPRLISPSPCYLKSLFLVFSLPQTSCWIACYTMHLGLRLFQLPSRSCLDSLDHVVVWIG